ncbi:hypothetical protein CXG81DRAFT_11224 [Caulochytrium protostelioides]|uniref:Peroxidase n=1 Tax=Caulochytrium protostelioides TaxID=1555241 RepID=A0A4P9XAE1_9FUNG|nr:hypothetical protein CXG81DRAFT_11224 [Caulochytrium protostelioides]|eukprot:RKP02100.1 hypothetical protein CXG81DRAFT_11224 [Caulochytrium protostelioides]
MASVRVKLVEGHLAGATNHPGSKDLDYQAIYNQIAAAIPTNPSADDAHSYGPVLVRLAWHASGTYDVKTNTGGSDGATMRHMPESGHGANAGLDVARAVLEPIKQTHPAISYADLWTLAGVCAIQEMEGPTIPWRPGRADKTQDACPPDGRLPDGARPDGNHLRDIFHRMGFDDREIVCLAGAHAVGRCHADRSGFDGPWTNTQTTLNNAYYRLLLSRDWKPRSDPAWKGPMQYADEGGKGKLMMLPADMGLLQDPAFRKWVEIYAKDAQRFHTDFAKAYSKLIELGVAFPASSEYITFKRTDE